MREEKLTALVPMKGHSERVKDKNIRNLAGKPLFFYILNTLQHCGAVDRVFVDTDSESISKMIRSIFTSVEIIQRPSELCGDYVSMNDIIRYDISAIDTDGFFIQTHATNPLLSAETICNAFDLFGKAYESGACDSLFSVNRLQTRLYDEMGNPLNHRKNELIRTQDLKPIYEENSNIYIFSKDSFLKNNTRIGDVPMMFEMNRIESMDIDTEEQFEITEQLYHIRQEEQE